MVDDRMALCSKDILQEVQYCKVLKVICIEFRLFRYEDERHVSCKSRE
jgi:hypothetical protein